MNGRTGQANVDLRRIGPYFSLDPAAEEQSSTAADVAVGMMPGIGTIQALRDFERARRSKSMLGMGLSSLAAVPIVGKPASKLAKPVVKKSRAAIGNLFSKVTDQGEAMQMALRGKHLKRTPSGGYVGAPPHIKSGQQLAAQRKKVDKLVDEGAFNMDWYDRARRTAERFGSGPRKQSLFARGGAAYSPQAQPPTEVGSFIKQHNAKVLTGEDVMARTKPQTRNVARAYPDEVSQGPYTDEMFKPHSIRLGPKTGPYADAKDPTVPEESLYKTANDIWHGRVMGYGEGFDRGFTPQEHGYLTGENLLLSNRAAQRDALRGVQRPTEWTPRSGQAATWGAKRKEGYIRDELARIEKANKTRKTPIMPDIAQITADAEAYAKAGIDDAVGRHSAYITSEARPGAGVGHLPMGEDEQALIGSYTDLVRDTTAKRDPIMESLGLFSSEAIPTRGYYPNEAGVIERNPGFAHQALVSTDMAGGPPRTAAPDRAALDYSTLMGAVLRGQEAGAHSRFMPEGMGKQTVAGMNAAMIEHGPLDATQRAALEAAAEQAGASPINYGGTTMVTQFGDEGPVPGTTKGIIDALRARGVAGKIVRGTAETGYEPTLLGTGGQADWVGGKATTNLMQRSEQAGAAIPGLEARTAPAVAQQAKAMNEIDAAIGAATGKPQRDDLVKLREVLSTGGLPALRAYVAKFGTAGLPAALLGVLGLQAAGQLQPQEGA